MIEIEVKGTDEIIKKILEVDKKLSSDDVKEYLAQKMLDVINRISEEKLKTNSNYVKHNKYKLIKEGIWLYNDVQTESGTYYSLILEYGSGTKAELNHIGTTDSFIKSGYTYWYVPESEAQNISDYNYSSYTTENGEVLYMVFGQEPKHIYTDAAKEIEKNVKSWLKEYIDNILGG